MRSLRQEWQRIQGSAMARNAAWLFLGQGLAVFCQAAYFIFLGRLLGSTQYGIYVGAMAMVAMVSQYSPFGSHSVLLRYVSADSSLFAGYWGNVLATTLGLGSILTLVIVAAGPHLATSYSRTMLLAVALGDCLCLQLTLSAGRVFQAFQNMRITASLNLMVNLLRAVLAGFLLFARHRGTATEWAVVSLVASAFAAAVSIILVQINYGGPRFSSSLFRERLSEGFVFALSYSTTGIYNDLDKVMLGHYGMNAANGVYAMAYRVIDVATMPVISVHGAAFPRFFQKGVDGIASTARFAVQIMKRTVPLSCASTLGLVAVAPIVPMLVGRSFQESSMAILWLAPLPFFRSFHLAAGDAITAAGFQNLRLGCQAAASVFNFGINLYLIPRYSWHGAAWSSLMTDALLAIINWALLYWLIAGRSISDAPVSSEARV